MNKKVYLAPQTEVTQVEANAILTGSTGATIPDAGWGNAKRSLYDIWEEDDECDEE